MFDSELETFKTSIDLRAYATTQGYVWDRKESWRGSTAMRHKDGDKIFVKRDADGHYVFFSVHRDGAHGSIIDFIQKRQGGSLGAVRVELRAWLGTNKPHGGRPTNNPSFPPLPATGKDPIRIETELARMPAVTRHPYLEQERKLTAGLLELPRFAGRIRTD